MEQVRHQGYPPNSYWPYSCSDVEIGLNLSNILQAILAPLFVFLLPGPGSIFKNNVPWLFSRRPSDKTVSGPSTSIYPRRSHEPWEPVSFLAAGWLCAAVVPVAWWYALRAYAGLHGECAELYDWSLPVHSYKPDYVADFFHYFIVVSIFSAFWAGVAAGGLRVQSARAAEGDSAGSDLRQFRGFYWACFLGWAVQYRITQWYVLSTSPTPIHDQQWVFWAFLNFVFVVASALWALVFLHSWWEKKPRTWLHAVVQAYWRSWAIALLTTLTFVWLILGDYPTLAPFLTWNVFGLAWALIVGTWRWRALQKQQLITVGTRPGATV
jgi:hypothetical protein